MKPGDSPEDLMKPYEFSVVSFYNPSDPKSQEVDALLEGAKLHLEKKVSEGEWGERSVGWFRINVEASPEMSLDGAGNPDQMVSGHGSRRMIGYERYNETKEKDAEMFAAIVKDLTGDWFTDIECFMIQDEERRVFDEVIYLGSKADLVMGGEAEAFTDLSMVDRYHFTD